MKRNFLILVAVMLTASFTSFAANKTEKFKVSGNCGMCEKRIEKAANGVEGVTSAEWNKDTKMMEVKFDDSKTDKDKIQTAIAKAGHDTGKHKAKDETYNNLPACCKYDRTSPVEKSDK
ncbi:heavy-metal-associated domain-containing protein [Saccharicrinis sp. FJH62]|uniref:heavy-metal-associated domain-containing protein n=1 Tax=Saccharicrinis sp. FJH62 TaxID=3344657 RepID=UPI0035D4CAA3